MGLTGCGRPGPHALPSAARAEELPEFDMTLAEVPRDLGHLYAVLTEQVRVPTAFALVAEARDAARAIVEEALGTARGREAARTCLKARRADVRRRRRRAGERARARGRSSRLRLRRAALPVRACPPPG